MSRECLIGLMQRVSAPRPGSAYFIGELFDFGVSRIFYKAPPGVATPAALRLYRFDEGEYGECFARPVTVDKNIRDPATWIQRVRDRSPFRDY